VPAIASYRYVEQSIHRRAWLRSSRSMAWVALALIVVPLLSGVLLARASAKGWWDPEIVELQQTTSA
jgi:hypothetical protein